jgi:hypothetical protein
MVCKSLLKMIAIAVLGTSTAALAQYTPPGMGTAGAPGTMPVYTQKSYGVNKAALGAALGGGVVGGALLLRHFRHQHHTMTACVGSDGKTINDGKDVYSVFGNSLTPNERLVVAAKKMKSDGGGATLEVTEVPKDLGRCEVPATVSALR